MFFVCGDNRQWMVPDAFIAMSPFLQQLAEMPQDPPPTLEESCDVCLLVMRAFMDHDLPRMSLASFTAMRRLIDKLQLPMPERLRAIGMVMVLETVRLSGVANPYDASAVMVLSVDLETAAPEVYLRLEEQRAYEATYWRFVTTGESPETMLVTLFGNDGYDVLKTHADKLRSRHAR